LPKDGQRRSVIRKSYGERFPKKAIRVVQAVFIASLKTYQRM